MGLNQEQRKLNPQVQLGFVKKNPLPNICLNKEQERCRTHPFHTQSSQLKNTTNQSLTYYHRHSYAMSTISTGETHIILSEETTQTPSPWILQGAQLPTTTFAAPEAAAGGRIVQKTHCDCMAARVAVMMQRSCNNSVPSWSPS